jgi:hypothetical protein
VDSLAIYFIFCVGDVLRHVSLIDRSSRQLISVLSDQNGILFCLVFNNLRDLVNRRQGAVSAGIPFTLFWRRNCTRWVTCASMSHLVFSNDAPEYLIVHCTCSSQSAWYKTVYVQQWTRRWMHTRIQVKKLIIRKTLFTSMCSMSWTRDGNTPVYKLKK